MRIEIFLDQTAERICDFFWTILEQDLAHKKKGEKIRIGLAGGSSPLELYKKISVRLRNDQNFEQPPSIEWVVIDERQVPLKDSESNLGALTKNLFEPARIPADKILAFDPSLDQDQAVLKMDETIKTRFHEGEIFFDLLILGAGNDGHIASLFTPQDCGNEALVFSSFAKDYPTQKRWSLGMKLLKSTRRTLLILNGESKRLILEKIQKGEAKNTALANFMNDAQSIEFVKSHE